MRHCQMSDRIIIVNAEHWLDKDGDLPMDGPPELFRNALRMAQCIEYAGPLPKEHLTLTLIQCRWRPEGIACRATLMVVKTEHDEILAFCPVCRRDEFLIFNWQDTMWADGPPEPVPAQEQPAPSVGDLPANLDQQLSRALRSVRCGLSVADIQRLVVTTDSPNMVIQQVMAASEPPGVPEMQGMAAALMAVWNATPRSELSDRAPDEVYREAQSRSPIIVFDKVARNEPCPCGSGRKYKKCCGAPH